MPRYFLNTVGVINALGADRDSVLANFQRGIAPGMQLRSGWLPDKAVMVGEVQQSLPEWPQHLAQFACRNNRLLLAAYLQIENSVQAAIARFGADRVGIVIGSSTSGIGEGEAAFAAQLPAGEFPSQFNYRQQEIGTPALALAAYLELTGIAYTVSTACSSSAKAFASARNLIALGLCDAVLVGGADSLCKLTINGFNALDSLAAQRCNPFSAHRDGINIGEGAALFLLTKEAGPVELLGIGECSDAHHISAPHPEGEGAETAMREALRDAKLEAADIDYINLHGTATPKNDEMESKAVARVFGATVPCSSTKSLTGHMLGAAGAGEIALCWLLLSALNADGVLPPQVWDGDYDAQLPPLNIVTAAGRIDRSRPARFLSNSFAFGGSNCAVIIEGRHDCAH